MLGIYTLTICTFSVKLYSLLSIVYTIALCGYVKDGVSSICDLPSAVSPSAFFFAYARLTVRDFTNFCGQGIDDKNRRQSTEYRGTGGEKKKGGGEEPLNLTLNIFANVDVT